MSRYRQAEQPRTQWLGMLGGSLSGCCSAGHPWGPPEPHNILLLLRGDIAPWRSSLAVKPWINCFGRSWCLEEKRQCKCSSLIWFYFMDVHAWTKVTHGVGDAGLAQLRTYLSDSDWSVVWSEVNGKWINGNDAGIWVGWDRSIVRSLGWTSIFIQI